MNSEQKRFCISNNFQGTLKFLVQGPHFLSSKVLKISYACFFFFLVWHIWLYKNVKSIICQNHMKIEDNEFGKHICDMHNFCINFLLLHKKLPSYTFQVSETLTWKIKSWNGLQMLVTHSSLISNHSYSSTTTRPRNVHTYTLTYLTTRYTSLKS